MKRTVLVLAASLFAPAAFSQGMMAPEPGMDAPTCGRFMAQDSVGQAAMLSTIHSPH